MTTITASQAAVILGIQPDTVSLRARRGRLQGEQVGRLWHFDEAYIREVKEMGEKKRKETRRKARQWVRHGVVHNESEFVPEQRDGYLYIPGPLSPEQAWSWRGSVRIARFG